MEKDLGWQALACTWLLFRIPIADFYEYRKTTFLDFLTLFPSFCIYTTFTRYDKKYSSTNTFNIFLKKKKEKRNYNQRRYDTKTRRCSRTISHSPSGELDSLIFNNFHQLFVRTSWTDGPSTISLPPPPPLFFHRFPPRQDSFASRFPDTWSIAVIYDLVKNGENHLFSRDMIYEGSREESRGGGEEGGMDGNGGWKRGGFSAKWRSGKTSHGNRSFCERAVSQLYCVMSTDRPLLLHRGTRRRWLR